MPKKMRKGHGAGSDAETGNGNDFETGNEGDAQIQAPKLTDQTILASSLVAEADLFTRHGDYSAAIPLYTRALVLKPKSLPLLVCRSRCRALQGDTRGALDDAETILAQDARSVRGVLCKADALFAGGDFEIAMVWYHRGERMRSEQAEFRRGIVRCREAIERAMKEVDVDKMKAARANARAHAAAVASETGGSSDASHTNSKSKSKSNGHRVSFGDVADTQHVSPPPSDSAVSGVLPQPRPQSWARRGSNPAPSHNARRRSGTLGHPNPPQEATNHAAVSFQLPAYAATSNAALSSVATSRATLSHTRAPGTIDHNLLEELFDDYVFLKDLQSDAIFTSASNGEIGTLVSNSVHYLEGRIDFWRARNPRGVHESTVIDSMPRQSVASKSTGVSDTPSHVIRAAIRRTKPSIKNPSYVAAT